MNYTVFTKDLRLSQYVDRLQFNIERSVFSCLMEPVSDHYAKNVSFGLCAGDDINARDHAYQVVQRLLEESWDETEAKRLKEQLCQDVRNYFDCLYLKVNRKQSDMDSRILVEMMAALDLERELIEIVRDYCKTWIESDKTELHSRTYLLDFDSDYFEMGDRALFIKGDAELAMKCYGLADLDWHHLRDEEYASKSALPMDKKNLLFRRHEIYEYHKKLMANTATAEEIKNDSTLNNVLKNIYLEMLEIEDQEEEYARYWELANQYFEELDKPPRVLHDAFGRLRSRFLIAHLIREKAMLAGLLCLAKETVDIQKSITEDVCTCISGSRYARLQPLRTFAQSKSVTYELLKQLLSFAETVFVTQRIRRDLLVQHAPEDMAYYTALETFFYMLPAKNSPGERCGRLSVMNIAYMNDPNEGKMLKRLIFKDVNALEHGRKSVRYPYVFMKCFTSRIDDLPMWEMYGNHAKGCCLILDWDKSVSFEKKAKTVPLYRVCYITRAKEEYKIYRKDNSHLSNECVKRIYNNLMKLRRLTREFYNQPEAMECFMVLLEDILYLFKDSSYSYEEELRIYYNYPSYSDDFKHTNGEYPMLFVQLEFDVHLKEIIIGPKFVNIAERMPYIQEQVEKMCHEIKGKVPRITISGIEYK